MTFDKKLKEILFGLCGIPQDREEADFEDVVRAISEIKKLIVENLPEEVKQND